MKRFNFSIIITAIIMMSCNQMGSGSLLSEREVQMILSEEIDDPIIEEEVMSARNLIKGLLDLELVESLELKEIYQQEEPLAINFQDRNSNLISYEAIKINESEIESQILTANQVPDLKVQELIVDNKNIKYTIDLTSKPKFIYSIISNNQSDLKLKMIIFCEENEIENINQYGKFMK